MQRQHPLAALLVLTIIAIGGWAYVTQPANKPAPAKTQTVPKAPSALLTDMESQDQRDAAKAHQMPSKILAAKIAKQLKKQGGNDMSVKIKPGQSAVVRVAFVANAPMSTIDPDPSDTYIVPSAGYSGSADAGNVNGSTTGGGWQAAWTSINEGAGGSVDVLIKVPENASAGDFTITLNSLNTITEGETPTTKNVDVYQVDFQVTGPLTGSVNVSQVSAAANKACVDLKADTVTDQKVTSAVIDWGDGNSTTVSPTPNDQHYIGSECHNYGAPGEYTISVTYNDDDSNTLTVTTTAKVGCVLASGIFVQCDPSRIVESPPDSGIYLHYYNVSLGALSAPSDSTIFWTWNLPDNATVVDGSSDTGAFGIGSAGANWPKTVFQVPTPSPDCSGDYGGIGLTVGLGAPAGASYSGCSVDLADDSVDHIADVEWLPDAGEITWILPDGSTITEEQYLASQYYYYATSPTDEIPVPTGCLLDSSHLNVDYPSLPAGYDASVDVQQQHNDLSWRDVGTITATGSVTIDAAQPQIFRFVAYKGDTAVYSLAITINEECSEGEGCPDGYHDDGTGNCLNDDDGATACATGYHWSGTACIFNTPESAIPAPDGCVNSVADDGTATLVFQPLTGVPSDITSAVLQHWNGVSYDDVKTLTLIEAATIFIYNLNPATILQFRWKLPTNDAGFQYLSDAFTFTQSCCDSGGGELTPDAPDAPTVVKSCADGTVTVSVVLPDGATSIEIARDDAPDTMIAPLTASGDFVDSSVADFGTYKYRARAKNLFPSDWSDWSDKVTFESSSLTFTWLSPAADYEAHGNVLLKFSVSGTVTDLALYVGGKLITPALTTKGGGIYTLSYDTRRAVQGDATIEIRGTGSDGCPARASLDVTFDNTRSDGILYRKFLTRDVGDGFQTNRLAANVVIGELDDDPTARFWGQIAIADGTVDAQIADDTSATDAQAAFDLMQPFPLNTVKPIPALGGNPGGTILGNAQTIIAPKQRHRVFIRQERQEWFLGYDTGSATIPKIREVEAGKYFIFSQTPDKAFVFQNDALTLDVDFETTEDASDVTDAAMVGKKTYFLNDGMLIVYVSGNRTLEFTIRREERTAQFIEGVGNSLYAILVDEDLETAQTLCVSLTGDAAMDQWTLDDVATLVWCSGNTSTNLFIACGKKLYLSVGGATPVLVGTFDSNITAICESAVGLADGSVKVLLNAQLGTWANAVESGARSISALANWYGSLEFINLMWGNADEATLYGQGNDHAYDVHRVLPAIGDVTPTGITALGRYFVPTEGSQPNPNNGYQAGDERILVGTAGGLLLTLMVARKTNASAWAFTTIDSINCAEIPGAVPAT